MSSATQETSAKTGGCHCGAVVWNAALPDEVTAEDCDCSVCTMTGFVHVIVPRRRFRLLRGAHLLTEYRWNTGVARHLFCSVCGVKSFYVPRSNPDGVSLNLSCMDRAQFASVTVRPFDGRNWEESAGALRHLSAN